MLFDASPPVADELLTAVRKAYRTDQLAFADSRPRPAEVSPEMRRRIQTRAAAWMERVRVSGLGASDLDALVNAFALSSREATAVTCLAEALLQLPDAESVECLLKDTLSDDDRELNGEACEAMFVNAPAWALLFSPPGTQAVPQVTEGWTDVLRAWSRRSGETAIRRAVRQAMRILGRQLILGPTIEDALDQTQAMGHRFCFDLMRPSSVSKIDAADSFQTYCHAIEAVGRAARGRGGLEQRAVTVRLSALHPRYEFAQRTRVLTELRPRLRRLAILARRGGIGLIVDAEEAERLELSLELIESVSGDVDLAGWDGFGLVVQAYQKRALPVIDWLRDMARRYRRRLIVHLVSGAYWETEINQAQQTGLADYPVFAHSECIDQSYLACADRLLAAPACFYPIFATQHPEMLAALLEIADGGARFEIQRMHGFSEALYANVIADASDGVFCRVRAPIGRPEDLLAYLVAGLLDTGAVSACVDQPCQLGPALYPPVVDATAECIRHAPEAHPDVTPPGRASESDLSTARGLDLTDYECLIPLAEAMERASATLWQAEPTGAAAGKSGVMQEVCDPTDRRRMLGWVARADAACVGSAVGVALAAQPAWDRAGAGRRADCLAHASDLFEAHGAELMTMLVREAGKTVPDALAELRAAVGLLRCHGLEARTLSHAYADSPAPREGARARPHGLGVIACISSWDSPLARFTGQVGAALSAGNAVIANPAEQTPLIAHHAVQLLYQAGVPQAVLHCIPAIGREVSDALATDQRVAAIALSGDAHEAGITQGALLKREGPMVPLIAHTGGLHAIFADSSVRREQVVREVLALAFRSRGWPFAPLRVLFVQSDTADRIIGTLAGAVRELRVGDPAMLRTDLGPMIDAKALAALQDRGLQMDAKSHLICRGRLGSETEDGFFFPPCVYEIAGTEQLDRHLRAPMLQVVRYASDQLDSVIAFLNQSGCDSTLRVFSNRRRTVERMRRQLRVRSLYVSGQQVGVQAQSATEPNAGEVGFVHRFAAERPDNSGRYR